MTISESGRSFEERLVALEEWMMHADRLLNDLNDVVRAVRDRMDEQDGLLSQLRKQVECDLQGDNEERSFQDEKPPHY